MEKTYKLLNHTEQMPIEEIKKIYDGYWIFMVNVRLTQKLGGDYVSGIPVIIGKTPFDGVEDGIYEKYKTDKYNQRGDLNLLPNTGFISALQFAR